MPKSTDNVIARVMTFNPPRRLVAAGIIRRTGGRTTRITATPAGITGSIRPAVTR